MPTAPGSLRRTTAVRVGSLTLGGGHQVRVQSMTKTDTADVAATVRQVRALGRAGCEIARIAVPGAEGLEAFGRIRKRVDLPLVADIHFDHRLALGAIDRGADKVRINPGNIGGKRRLREVARRAAAVGCALRIGVNAGSLEKGLLRRFGGPAPEALVESAAAAVAVAEDAGFGAIVLSLKASSVTATLEAYRLAARRFSYPLHLGVTEAGWGTAGVVKSAIGIGALLAEGIGETLRVSLTSSPLEEVRVAWEILAALGLRRRGVEIISCPTCGRCGIDLMRTARRVKRELASLDAPLTVAVMGCAVNGPGEAREADVGLAGGKGRGVIFRQGKVLKTLAESEMIPAFVETVHREARRRSRGKGED